MLAVISTSVIFSLLRRVWLYAVIAIAGYQLGAHHADQVAPRVAAPQVRHGGGQGYIKAPGFHFND